MIKITYFFMSICGYLYGSHANGWGQKEDIVLPPMVHHASTSIVSARISRGVIDLQDVPRVTSDDSVAVNVATTIDVKAKCCNSNCCDEDKGNKTWCCC